ncbi:MAG: hypothetical protein ABJB69_10605 [Spartobacteria bacterium]
MKKILAFITMSILAIACARAVILLDTGDPTVNVSAPTGTLANSGWQFEGTWGGFLGTPIAPHFFISAAHIGQAGGIFSYQGSNYTPIRAFSLPNSDLLIWQVKETFPNFAPLFSKSDEVGRHLVVIGRGTERGGEVMLNGTPRGWNWGSGTGIERWGENDVVDLVPYLGHDLVYATFDQHELPNDRPNESHLSGGDSGGAVFLNDNGTWKLAAINFAVDDLYSAPASSSQFTATIFDARGFYTFDGTNFTQITSTAAVPTGFYSSRISSELAWIGGVIAEPQVGREGNFITLTYTKLNVPSSEVTYVVQQSNDLVSWSTATTQDDLVSSNGDLQTIKAKVDMGTWPRLFLRLQITRPTQLSHATASFIETVAIDNGIDVFARAGEVDVGQKIFRRDHRGLAAGPTLRAARAGVVLGQRKWDGVRLKLPVLDSPR